MSGFSFLRLAGLVVLAGCFGGGPPPIRPPSVDPEDAAAEALHIYDKDADGALAGSELEQVPAISRSLDLYDADGDQRVTEEELARRLEALYASRIGLMPVHVSVTLDRRPLEGATVRLEPEPFLGESVKPAEGIADRGGVARMAVPDELLPESDLGLEAMQIGLYKVRITHPARRIPARYNEQTTLGFALDPAQVADELPTFELRSR